MSSFGIWAVSKRLVSSSKKPWRRTLSFHRRAGSWPTPYLREPQQPDRVLELLAPLEQAFPTQFEVVAGLGFAHYMKEAYDRAADYLAKARQIRPPDAMLLNALADAHQRLGNTDAAREAFQHSLELDPGQEVVKNRLAALAREQ